MEPAGAIDPRAQTGRRTSRRCAARNCKCCLLPTARRRRLAPGKNAAAQRGDSDRQSVKAACDEYDAGKRVNWCKRHAPVDTLRLVWLAAVTAGREIVRYRPRSQRDPFPEKTAGRSDILCVFDRRPAPLSRAIDGAARRDKAALRSGRLEPMQGRVVSRRSKCR